jgi:hypothetical protein
VELDPIFLKYFFAVDIQMDYLQRMIFSINVVSRIRIYPVVRRNKEAPVSF